MAGRAKAQAVTARLCGGRVPDLNPDNQSELFTAYRYHAVFTNSPLPMLQAEKAHRAHAIVEQVIADHLHERVERIGGLDPGRGREATQQGHVDR